MTLTIVILVFIIGLAMAIPVAVTLGLASILPGLVDGTFTAGGGFVVRSMVGGLDSFPLLAIPMFVLSGIIMARGGVSKRIFNIIAYFFGERTAGMPCAVIITCLFYGSISGSAPATVAAVGSMTIPLLIDLGYDKAFSTAIVAVSGGLGVIIPPSIPFILYGTASGASVGKLFIAGIIPGLLIAFLLIGYSIIYCRRYGEDKEKIRAQALELKSKGVKQLFIEGIWALLAPLIILGCIYTGVASPTEAAVISVIYSLFVSLLIYKSIQLKSIIDLLKEAVRTYSPLLFILSASVAFSRILTLLEVPQLVSTWILSYFSGKIAILIIINLFLLIIGMVMDTTPAILIATPILLPIVEALGISPIHFGIIMVVNLAIGFVTPPIGVNLFIASSLTEVPVTEISKKAMPMIICFLIALILITFVPVISLGLL